jgi:hypothetical protein
MAVSRTVTFSVIAGVVQASATVAIGNRSIGAAASDRQVYVGITSTDVGSAGTTISSVLINGSPMTLIGKIGSLQETGWWWLEVPTGTTALIDIVYSGATVNHAISVTVYRVTGANTAPIIAVGGNVATAFPVAITVPTDGVALAIGTKAMTATSGITAAWTGLTEDVDSFVNISGVYDINLTSASSVTAGVKSVSVTWTSAGSFVVDAQIALVAIAPAGVWSFVGIGTNVVVTTTGITLTEPAGTQVGDLLVACIGFRAASATSVTLPAGWTRVGEQKTGNTTAATSTSIANACMAYIVRGASPPGYGFTLPAANVGMGQVVAYRGQHTTPFDLASAATTATAITAVSVTGLTTTVANELLVAMVGAGRGGTWTNFRATTPGTGSGATDITNSPSSTTWAERADNTSVSGADVGLAVFDAIKATAGATGNFLTTGSLSGGHAVIVGAFKLAPAVVQHMKVWSGSAWVAKPVKYWTGSAWVEKPIKFWNGSAWV